MSFKMAILCTSASTYNLTFASYQSGIIAYELPKKQIRRLTNWQIKEYDCNIILNNYISQK